MTMEGQEAVKAAPKNYKVLLENASEVLRPQTDE
jgi:hypothetical protein